MKFVAMAMAVTLLATQQVTMAKEKADKPGEVAAKAVMGGNDAFALKLYGQLLKDAGTGGDNLFFSPYSLSSALAMTYQGAREETADQMRQVLTLPADNERLLSGYGTLHGRFNAKPNEKRPFELTVANALWGRKGMKFLDPFLTVNRKAFGAGLEALDFADSEAARATINAWVEKQTREKIKDLIKPGMITSDTALVLTNAIYFKGTWASPFEKEQTKEESFRVSTGKELSVPMMSQEQSYKYAEDPAVQVMEMPYAGNELSMVVVLPKAKEGLAAVEKDLSPERMKGWTDSLRERPVRVSLPRYKMASEFSLAQTLSAMGMPSAFSEGADFSGMTGDRRLFISAVVHKAFVDVNEEGTEAAAATGVAVAELAMATVDPPVVFRADHPFIFIIRHQQTGGILFMGRVANPKG